MRFAARIVLIFSVLLALSASFSYADVSRADVSYADVSYADVSADAGEARVRSVNHRGFCVYAPENTMPAYERSADEGFDFVETDVCFTKDNVPVLLHDDTINRTARNIDGSEIAKPIWIGDLTYRETLLYDFGIWKGPEFVGARLPKLESFLELCKDRKLHPYLELKKNGDYTQDQIEMVVDMVDARGMRGNVTWISFELDYLRWVAEKDPEARLGYLSYFSTEPETVRWQADVVSSLKTGSNYVFLDLGIVNQSSYPCAEYENAGVPVEVWVIPFGVDEERECLENLDPYITGVTADQLHYASPEVVLSAARFVYDGHAKVPDVTVRNNIKTLTAGVDYLISFSGPGQSTDAGQYSVTVKLTDKYAGPITEVTKTFTIDKAANPLKLKGKTAKVKYSSVTYSHHLG